MLPRHGNDQRCKQIIESAKALTNVHFQIFARGLRDNHLAALEAMFITSQQPVFCIKKEHMRCLTLYMLMLFTRLSSHCAFVQWSTCMERPIRDWLSEHSKAVNCTYRDVSGPFLPPHHIFQSRMCWFVGKKGGSSTGMTDLFVKFEGRIKPEPFLFFHMRLIVIPSSFSVEKIFGIKSAKSY